ncbi:MAG: UDP-N-acetylmuramoyl-L-alanine--D-glutamate ligase [Gammaproteobacteria bacterium]|nr:UDP-N-acetylmuramoyl-L-alanine--D-glutamate ligase [Gammaproteobacteria bacterium]MBU6510246.1 UDP-N-acetylmuramoyl-L-alanine--D-glutamate ligase [Gammaproteobacteria bacterium]MDE1984096.1 UDP-N-acetylmuramoyl-L-alanine--D-glutamate ligase [Gammaproteobacteria bacterium]MDE2108931.1 UDP-N-acetylmuramoyl-L-alanine--D-glutamate ligase [Gammaproteobacteria bacterium]MDE2461469.1 UDP-N-acetylmuramoyl-L-alanine--D-glutamate ligase [Gammaproteobacteria bacterium]
MHMPQAHHKTLVVGLGRTGLSCVRFLAAHGAEVAVTDSRARPPALAQLRELVPQAAVFVGGFSEQALAGAEQVLVSPGVAANAPFLNAARARGLPVFGDVELFARTVQAPVVGITGSNGKSTVTSLLGLMAERAGIDARVGGNLGTPALDLVRDQEPQLYVLELSSFQLEVTESLHCVAAAVLNISPDHLDRHATLEDYAAAKARIYRHCGTAVFNREDAQVRRMVGAGQKQVSFGLDAPRGANYGLIEHAGERWLACGGERLLKVSELRIRGAHNVANALAALALGAAAGLPRPAMLAALHEFAGLPHRMQYVGSYRGVEYYDDSKGTNVGATLAAVAGVSQPLVLIAGGDGKHQDFTPLAPALAGKARSVVLLGKDAAVIETALAGRVPTLRVKDMDAAVAQAAQRAQPGDWVLLSPACSSLDMFDNFEHRGRVFAAAVGRLGHG